MADTYSFRFVDDELNQKLIDRATSSGIPHEIGPDGTLRFSAENDEVIEERVIRPVREEVFPRWQMLSCPPEWAGRYRQYMRHNRLPFQEERIDNEISFLIPRDLDPHRWNLEMARTARTR
jgi:hypothetical protein